MGTDEVDGLDVAAAILEQRPGLTQMQLHKLTYLVQAADLAWFGEAVYENRIEAWQMGPMVRGVAGTYMHFGDSPIPSPVIGDSWKLSDRETWIVSQIVEKYEVDPNLWTT